MTAVCPIGRCPSYSREVRVGLRIWGGAQAVMAATASPPESPVHSPAAKRADNEGDEGDEGESSGTAETEPSSDVGDEDDDTPLCSLLDRLAVPGPKPSASTSAPTVASTAGHLGRRQGKSLTPPSSASDSTSDSSSDEDEDQGETARKRGFQRNGIWEASQNGYYLARYRATTTLSLDHSLHKELAQAYRGSGRASDVRTQAYKRKLSLHK